MRKLRTRSQEAAAAAPTLGALSDDAFQLIIAACDDADADMPLLDAVKGLACVSNGMLQQLHRLRPLVGVRSLAVLQRPAHGPWLFVLLYRGRLTAAVLEQARHRRVRLIRSQGTLLAPAMAKRVVPELLGAGCSLHGLNMSHVELYGTWATRFGKAAVCSAVMRSLQLSTCGLRGPLPKLRLPALQTLDMSFNHLTGGLEPLQDCTALKELRLSHNQLAGGLEPLRGCTALRTLYLSNNQLTGELEPLRRCKALQELYLRMRKHTLVATEKDQAHFEKQCQVIVWHIETSYSE